MARLPGTRLGAFRAYFFGFFICTAGLMFGFDTGCVGEQRYRSFLYIQRPSANLSLLTYTGGVLTLKSYKRDFGFTNNTSVSAVMVSIQNVGAFLAALLIFPVSERLGRKKTIMGACAIFCLGVILQVVPSHSLLCFYIGRFIAGLGLGAATAVAPAYNAEMAPKEIRGKVGSGVQLMFAAGVMISYWIDYGVTNDMPVSSAQWQIPIGLQLVPAAVLGLGLFAFPESCRWLAKKERYEEAWASLSWIRGDDGEYCSSNEFPITSAC